MTLVFGIFTTFVGSLLTKASQIFFHDLPNLGWHYIVSHNPFYYGSWQFHFTKVVDNNPTKNDELFRHSSITAHSSYKLALPWYSISLPELSFSFLSLDLSSLNPIGIRLLSFIMDRQFWFHFPSRTAIHNSNIIASWFLFAQSVWGSMWEPRTFMFDCRYTKTTDGSNKTKACAQISTQSIAMFIESAEEKRITAFCV